MAFGGIELTVSPETEELAEKGIKAMQDLSTAIVSLTCLIRELRSSRPSEGPES